MATYDPLTQLRREAAEIAAYGSVRSPTERLRSETYQLGEKLPYQQNQTTVPSVRQNQVNLPNQPTIPQQPPQNRPYGGTQNTPSGVSIVQNPNLPQGYGVDPRTGRIAKVGTFPLEVTTASGGTPDPFGRRPDTTETVRDKFPEFSFDEAFARRGAEEEYSPFFTERLQDFLGKYTNQKSRLEQDVSRALSELEEDERARSEEEGKEEKESLEDIDETFARRGLFYSGARHKARGRLQELRGARESSIKRELERRRVGFTRGRERTLSDAETARSQYERDLLRTQKESIEEAVQRRRSEALLKYLANLASTYGEDVAGSFGTFY